MISFPLFREYLTNRSQTVFVDGQPSQRVDVISGVPQGSVLGPLMFNIYTRDLAGLFENMFFAYADDSTLLAIIPSPKARVEVARSLIRDLVKLQVWCVAWGMMLNLLKTKAMLISRSFSIIVFLLNPELTEVSLHSLLVCSI